ncbi:ankyrin repeat-containing protein [Aspergillus niger]|nr:ankyrin repeat-containing protein [Aspergillus niger]
MSDTGNFAIQEFTDVIPPYAILSHTWSKEEVTYQEINAVSAKRKCGYEKIIKCCSVARATGYEYVWIDTCCIDKTSSAELSEAINSMYHWYQKAGVCYAYLADIQSKDEFTKSKWFTRGWTLQELIAPSRVVFLNREWEMLGDKTDLRDEISIFTGIPANILSGEEDLEMSSVAQRMSWAAKRETSRVEDRAYSLMGIFNVNMPLIYGEGENAFIRLQEEIMRISDDQSLFAWVSSHNRGGLLATFPDAFAHCHNIVRSNPFGTRGSSFSMSSTGVHLDLGFIGVQGGGLGLAILNCTEETRGIKAIGIYLRDLSLTMNLFKRVHSGVIRHIDLSEYRPTQYPVRRICVQAGRTMLVRQPTTATDTSVLEAQGDYSEYPMPPKNRVTPVILVETARSGNTDDVWLLLTRTDVKIEVTDENGQTPLSLAVANGHEGIVMMFLEKGASTETKDISGRTPLLLAVANGYEGIIMMLLKKGASTEIIDISDQTPLSLAVTNGHEGIVKMLLEKGASTETKDRSGWTPLSLAVVNGHEGIVRLLLKHGAKTETDNWMQPTPLYLAVKNKHVNIVKLLLEHGAEIETGFSFYSRPLSQAVADGHEDIVKLLLENGAEPEAGHELGRTPLLQAVVGGHEGIVKLLLKYGAKPDNGHSLMTLLSLAVMNGHEGIVKLLEKGATTDKE